MEITGPRFAAAVRRAYVLLLSALSRAYTATTRAGGRAADALRAGYAWLACRSNTALARLTDRLRAGRGRLRRLAGPAARTLTGPVATAVFGRRTDVSASTLVVAPVLAVATEWWAATRLGWPTVREWVLGTWYGTEPHTAVFLWAAALLALAAASAAVNSGVLPTTLLVAGPLFGVAFTRYGTSAGAGDAVVSLPDAAVVGGAMALLFAVPLALAGFVVGVGVRRAARGLGGVPDRLSAGDRV